MHRRQFLRLVLTGAALSQLPTIAHAGGPLRLVLVHGRAQQDLNPEALKAEWIDALKTGAAAGGRPLPDVTEVAFPYYGDRLDELARNFNVPLTSEIMARGDDTQDEFLVFQAQVAEELRQRAGVTDAQVDLEYGDNPEPRGPLNWEWVQAILRALDKHGGGLSRTALELFTRDVFIYTTRPGVRDAVDAIVRATITEQPTVVIAHSLGSVVAYSALTTDPRGLSVPLYVTLGCPLGIRAIRDQFRPIRYPVPVKAWFNGYDQRDVVALFPLDLDNFPVVPPIENFSEIDNHTDDHHGIVGYLDDRTVANRVLTAIGG